MIILGVDPGQKGAIAILPIYSIKETQTLSFEDNTISDIIVYLSELKGGEPGHRIDRAQHIPNKGSDTHLNIKVTKRFSPVHRKLNELLRDKEEHIDGLMEMYLEEPGQIIPYHKMKGRDATKAILAGTTATRKLARNVGLWEGIGACLNTPIYHLPPKKWQSELNCKNEKGSKKASRELAKKLFPKLKVTDINADALLLATYGYLQYANTQYITSEFRSYLPRGVLPVRRINPDEIGKTNITKIATTKAPSNLSRRHQSYPLTKYKRKSKTSQSKVSSTKKLNIGSPPVRRTKTK